METSSSKQAYSEAHKLADTDQDRMAIHHTLGIRADQAAPGNHKHDTLYSPVGHTHEVLGSNIKRFTSYLTADTIYSSSANSGVISGMECIVPVEATNEADIIVVTYSFSAYLASTWSGVDFRISYNNVLIGTNDETRARVYGQGGWIIPVSKSISLEEAAAGNHSIKVHINWAAGSVTLYKGGALTVTHIKK